MNHRDITRITYENISRGQRPYGDTFHGYRVTFERQWRTDEDTLRPWDLPEERVRQELKRLSIGFVDPDDKLEGWWSTRLEYLRKIAPGVWEFETRSPYTD